MNQTTHLDPTICPICDAMLCSGQIAGGWCETCGKKLPGYITGWMTLARGLALPLPGSWNDPDPDGPGALSA